MSDNALGEILAKLTSLDVKVDSLGKGVDTLGSKVDGLGTKVDALDTKVDGLDTKVDTLGTTVNALGAKVDALDTRVDQLDIAQTKMRVDIMVRIDELADQVRFMRGDIETTFNTADRSGRINQDHIRSLDEQLASMVRQQRLLDSRLRALEEKNP